jgi:hypothetical protein
VAAVDFAEERMDPEEEVERKKGVRRVDRLTVHVGPSTQATGFRLPRHARYNVVRRRYSLSWTGTSYASSLTYTTWSA